QRTARAPDGTTSARGATETLLSPRGSDASHGRDVAFDPVRARTSGGDTRTAAATRARSGGGNRRRTTSHRQPCVRAARRAQAVVARVPIHRGTSPRPAPPSGGTEQVGTHRGAAARSDVPRGIHESAPELARRMYRAVPTGNVLVASVRERAH